MDELSVDRVSKPHKVTPHEFWAVNDAAVRLSQYACTISAQHIEDGGLRSRFNREVTAFGKSVVEDVEQARKPVEHGLEEINNEYRFLRQQVTEYAKLVAGLSAGALQFGTGAMLCYSSAGVLCGLAGAPMMLHGLNNAYESGRNIIQGRTDTQGPLRKAYQMTAQSVGGRVVHGNMAYGLSDIGLSVYGLWRMVLKPDAWRLFRYIDADKTQAHRVMGSGPLVFEVGIDMMTGEQVYVESQK
ncbi:DUF4225 domain-containing protein [Pseudomonas sp. B21-035]|uniref:DUF4225 domain-containing protein n=1 Tax=Pseudomonas sp. B21-035 TaxID=2895484 RepID=UPI00215EE2AB|nr:DUF4225 domain-containing protein [Pseudomonas sp. B21-035]UVL54391.1 DUF4225 domain-containing protein [Pseudomonas sp. B21-035]